jgi:hypothetical protein
MSRFFGQLFPTRESLNSTPRLAVALVLNVTMAIYVLPQIDRVWSIRDYRYAPLDWLWISVIVVIPMIVLAALVPVMLFGLHLRRWLAIILGIFPAYLALAGWIQLVDVWSRKG